MIHLTRINRAPIVLNSDLIEYIEKTPDTVVSLTNGVKLLVLESPDEIIDLVVTFRRGILQTPLSLANGSPAKPYPFTAIQPVVTKMSRISGDKE